MNIPLKKLPLEKLKNLKNKGKELTPHLAKIDKRFLIFTHDVIALFAAMQLAMWFVMRDDLSLLSYGFIFKQSLIFALISSGFFLWFQTYKGVWRYVSWRQSALIIGVLGFASLIFFPLMTKAHMQPISIPNLVVLVNWVMASTLLIGSRVFFRIFYERWLTGDDSALADTPVSRIILVGAGPSTNNFLTELKHKKQYLYDVIGIVESDPKVGASLHGVDILGSLADLPDLIENFNSEGMHPHHIVITDSSYLGSKVRSLLSNLASFKVDFMTLSEDKSALVPLAIEDVFYEDQKAFSSGNFSEKCILIYGVTCALGQEFVKLLSKNSKVKIILWDQNVQALLDLKKRLGVKGQQNPVTFLSKASYSKEQLTSYLKQQKVDVFINLKAFSAAAAEPLDSSLSFEVYVEENEHFSKIAQEAGVKNYFFMTQKAPHCHLATRLMFLSNHILKARSTQSKLSCAMINLPYILHGGDHLFQGRGHYQLPQDSLSVTTPAYGAYMMGCIVEAILGKESQSTHGIKSDFKMETVSYEVLAQFFSLLNHQAPMPTYSTEPKGAPSISWNDKAYRELQGALSLMDYGEASECLEKFYV